MGGGEAMAGAGDPPDPALQGRLRLQGRARLLGRVLVALLLIGAVKITVHRLGWEILSANRLFSALVASDVFLLGFLLNGVLADYKESERLPSELGAALECLGQEVDAVRLTCAEAEAEADVEPALAGVVHLAEGVLTWLQGGVATADLLARLDGLYPKVVRLSRWNAFPLQARLLLELANLRRATLRIETIRRTTFVPTVYLLAYMVTALLCAGLVLSRIDPFGEAMFFLGVIAFLVIFLLLLISDLDNPFNYRSPHSFEDVALPTLEDAVARVRALRDPLRRDERRDP